MKYFKFIMIIFISFVMVSCVSTGYVEYTDDAYYNPYAEKRLEKQVIKEEIVDTIQYEEAQEEFQNTEYVYDEYQDYKYTKRIQIFYYSSYNSYFDYRPFWYYDYNYRMSPHWNHSHWYSNTYYGWNYYNGYPYYNNYGWNSHQYNWYPRHKTVNRPRTSGSSSNGSSGVRTGTKPNRPKYVTTNPRPAKKTTPTKTRATTPTRTTPTRTYTPSRSSTPTRTTPRTRSHTPSRSSTYTPTRTRTSRSYTPNRRSSSSYTPRTTPTRTTPTRTRTQPTRSAPSQSRPSRR